VRSQTGVPLAVGFGVSNPEQARKVSQYADGVIIGSRLIKMISDAVDIDSACSQIESFLAEVNGALEG
jgi:tryptophan synthase alpha chain